MNDVVIKAAALALAAVPEVNVRWVRELRPLHQEGCRIDCPAGRLPCRLPNERPVLWGFCACGSAGSASARSGSAIPLQDAGAMAGVHCDTIDIAIAVSVPGGLITPIVKTADKKARPARPNTKPVRPCRPVRTN